MEIIVQIEEYEGKTVGVKARKLPPNYETDWYVDEDKHTFREFVLSQFLQSLYQSIKEVIPLIEE